MFSGSDLESLFICEQWCLRLPHSQSMLYSPGFLQLCISKELLKETVATPPFLSHLLLLHFSYFSSSLPSSLFFMQVESVQRLSFIYLQVTYVPRLRLNLLIIQLKILLQNLFPSSSQFFSPLCRCSWFGVGLLRLRLMCVTHKGRVNPVLVLP